MVPTVADQVKLLQTAPEATVTVLLDNPELESKTTSSDDVGAVCPPAPPEKLAQFVVVDASQVPDPPTQYLVAENETLETNKKKNRILIFIVIVYLINEFL